MPAGAAIAWWLIASVGFCGGYFTATLMDSAVSGQIPQRMRQFLIGVGVLVLAGAGQAASAPSPIPTISGVLAGLAALCLGALMAYGACRLRRRERRVAPGRRCGDQESPGTLTTGFDLSVEPVRSCPIGWLRPPRCLARKASATA